MTLTSFPDPVDQAALRDFHARHGDVSLGPVVVVIAAYNEEAGIRQVLDRIPADSCSLAVSTLVVVDGATDGTGEAALEHEAAYTCLASTNRGQGAALRLGYHLAGECGARYIVTTDADGQYNIDGMPELLKPLIADEADFVSGSRLLGGQETDDLVRRAGVHVFARLISCLTGKRVTDTSFGFRGMKAEVAGAVTLEQPQYQSSELLIGVLSHGFRVLERPMRMRKRTAGSTKKGTNVVYGASYSGVVLRTWWRERRRKRRGAVVAHPVAADDPHSRESLAADER